ncbi:MAG: UDP-N-acetylglucosamine 1-carboxyvinyltransferase [Ruminococcus sp.]|nr:UDP-N-acetylglucosamine 1-carboxyvinyltransferase [Ruminococcus sp.]
MQRLKIYGKTRISGEISVQGAKNSALPLLSACVLSKGKVTLHNCPRLSDVFAACRILSCLGCSCSFDGNTVTIDSGSISKSYVPDSLMREMRSSIVFLGAILGKMGECSLSFPGGCELGPRPIDMHLSALRQMGVLIREEYGLLHCTCPKGLKGAKISLSFPSVGATENIMLAACLAKGDTFIYNAAREPEIIDLASFLNLCGARISGHGGSVIRITGVKELHGCEYSVMPDRIVACTLLGAAAITEGEITLKHSRPHDIDAVLPVFEQMGCNVYVYDDNIYLNARQKLQAVRTIRTMPYPGFPTDAQAIIMAVLTKAHGTSVIVENIFENRYRQVDELVRMGANIKVEGKVAVIEGVKNLYGANVVATDLRGGAALVIAALAADGETVISNIKLIDRGYEDIEKQLDSVGAKIYRY